MRTDIQITGMSCAGCAAAVRKAITALPGVASAEVNYAVGRAAVEYDPSAVGPTEIAAAVVSAGYGVAPGQGVAQVGTADREFKRSKMALLAGAVLAALIMAGNMGRMLPWMPAFLRDPLVLWLLATPVQFGLGLRFYRAAWNALKHGTADMNTLIVVGTSSAYFYSVAAIVFRGAFSRAGLPPDVYFDTSAAIIVLILLGRMLEARARGWTSEAVRRLMGLRPAVARLVRNGEEREVPIESIVPGDVLAIRPGDRIPVDGVIVAGRSAVDESMISGESLPVDKASESEVTGGTLNTWGSFTFRAVRVGRDTVLARIIKLVEEAQGGKAPIQRLADRIAARFVPAVVSIAVLTFLVWLAFGPKPALNHALLNFVAVLIIACPCALGLATPTAIMVGTGRGAEKGILIKSGEALETAGRIDTVVFDKTGTLTSGRPEVTGVTAVPPFDERQVLRLAAAAEAGSEHPLGRAVVRKAGEAGLDIPRADDFRALEGLGVECRIGGRKVEIGSPALAARSGIDLGGLPEPSDTGRGLTSAVVAVDGRAAGRLSFRDPLRPSAAPAVARLKTLGLKVVMLTGDGRGAARAAAAEAGIDDVVAEVRPWEKVEAVKKLQDSGRRVAFVGDGINDAPALAQADVGLAVGTGADVAVESAGITVMGEDLGALVSAVALSRATLRTIKQNLFWAFFYNAVGIPVAAGALYPFLGITLSPVIASAAMAFSSVSVVSNSLRLRRTRL